MSNSWLAMSSEGMVAVVVSLVVGISKETVDPTCFQLPLCECISFVVASRVPSTGLILVGVVPVIGPVLRNSWVGTTWAHLDFPPPFSAILVDSAMGSIP